MWYKSDDTLPSTLASYGGGYILNDLLREKISVSKISAFNDPYEAEIKLHISTTAELDTETRKRKLSYLKNRIESTGASPQEAIGLANFITNHCPDLEQKAIQYTQEEISRRIAHEVLDLTCRISCWVNPSRECDADYVHDVSMWGYYADNHHGVRVHVYTEYLKEISQTALYKVDYVPTPPKISLYSIKNKDPNDLLPLLKTKSEAWIHEQEIRMICGLQEVTTEPDSVDGTPRDFIALPLSKVARIDLGIRITEGSSEWYLAKKIARAAKHIEFYRTKKTAGSYSPTYEPIF